MTAGEIGTRRNDLQAVSKRGWVLTRVAAGQEPVRTL